MLILKTLAANNNKDARRRSAGNQPENPAQQAEGYGNASAMASGLRTKSLQWPGWLKIAEERRGSWGLEVVMPALSLKTKLVLSITAMVVAIINHALHSLYLEVVHQRIQEVAQSRYHRAAHVCGGKTGVDQDLSAEGRLNDPAS
jgi:hypothetical protein